MAGDHIELQAGPAEGGPQREKPFVTFVRAPIISTFNAINNEATPSIAYAYLSAYIQRHGYSFAWVDAVGEALNKCWPLEKYPGYQAHGLTFDEILARIPRHTDVIAISAMFSGEWPVVRDLITEIRSYFPEALIIAGGEQITALTEYSLRDCEALDVCVRGEGEHVLFEVLESFWAQGDFSQVNGISYLREDGAYIANDAMPRIREVDDIPWPYWPEGYLEKFWEAGKSYGTQSERDMPIMASRGCPYRCTFCSSPQMWTTRYVLRDPDDLIAEIKHYIARYDITSLQFYDLTAITKKRWTVEFCNKMIDNRIRVNWSLPSGTRSEALDAEVLALLKRTHCNYLVYAPESGSRETLVKIKKRINLEKLTRSVLEAKRQGITLRVNLIIGFPHETLKNVFETIRFGLYLVLRGVDEVPIFIYSPYPGTEIFDELIKECQIKVDDSYFLGLTSINSDITIKNPLIVNKHIAENTLRLCRKVFLLLNYFISYALYPARILRSIRNVFSAYHSATVFEHRLKDLISRKGWRRSAGAKDGADAPSIS